MLLSPSCLVLERKWNPRDEITPCWRAVPEFRKSTSKPMHFPNSSNDGGYLLKEIRFMMNGQSLQLSQGKVLSRKSRKASRERGP